MRLSNEVFLVGGSPTSCFGLSPHPDCHVYLVNGGDELALIDCGLGGPGAVDQIVDNIRAEGLDPARLRYLLVTHYHMDHVGAAAQVRERFGLQVMAAREAARSMRTGDEKGPALDVAKKAGVYPADYHFQACPVDRELAEWHQLQVGDLKLEVYETPGHCGGHLAFLLLGHARRYLFSGDLVFYGGRIVLQNIHDCDIHVMASSVTKLAGLQFEALLPGHDAIALNGGMQHVQVAAAAFNKLFLPRSLA